MEQTRFQLPVDNPIANVCPMLVTGDAEWENYTLKATVRVLSRHSYAGILFRYISSRCHYGLYFEDGKLCLYKNDQEDMILLSSVDFPYDCDTNYNMEVVLKDSQIVCSVDGKEYLRAEDYTWARGKIALAGRIPAQFTDIEVLMSPDEFESVNERKKQKETKTARLREKYPQPVLWKALDLKNFGAGRQLRFGHLTGTEEIFMVFAQNQKRVSKDAYAHISCLTAVNLDGEILWQLGEPSSHLDNAYLTADLPFQVCDVDMDGVDEVILARNFKLMILDGRTGKVKKSIPTPLSEEPDESLIMLPGDKFAFERINVDSIRIANFSGKEKATDILIKDRYNRVWVYDNELNFMWKFQHGNTGHFPCTVDIDGDGKDELISCYNLVDHDGKLLWSLPIEEDHVDEIIVGHFDPSNPEEVIGMVAGHEGFILADTRGNILKKQLIGHAQRISAGNYRTDLPGLDICVSTYWGSQGIIYIFDCKGELLHQFEPSTNGNIISPVNWVGDGSELILLNGNSQYGGMIDGHGNQVVRFPDDGHPELCAEVLDLTGDERDEIILWDEKRMYIYTQDNILKSDRRYVPIKYPNYNGSNYRGEFSYPRWIDNLPECSDNQT